MFRAMISPIFRSTRLCLQLVVIMHPRCCRPATSSVHYTTSCKHSLVLLKMGEIIARTMLSLWELLINRYCCIYFVVYFINKHLPVGGFTFFTLPHPKCIITRTRRVQRSTFIYEILVLCSQKLPVKL